MKDIMNNKISIEVTASGRPLMAHVLAITRLSDEEVTKSINEIIAENGITYEDFKPPRSKTSHLIANQTKFLIEKKMNDIGIEIYIYGFLTVETEELCCSTTNEGKKKRKLHEM